MLPIIGFALPDGTIHSAFGGSAKAPNELTDPIERARFAIEVNTNVQRQIVIEAEERGKELMMAEKFMNQSRLTEVMNSLTHRGKFER